MSEHGRSSDRFVYLTGRPPIREFVRFVKARTLNDYAANELTLTRQWNETRARIAQLEQTEAGCADIDQLAPLPESFSGDAEAELRPLLADRGVGHLQRSWALIDLDRVIVWQKYIDSRHAQALGAQLPPKPGMEELIRLSLGKSPLPPPLRIATISGNQFSFASSSNDLQILGTAALPPESVRGYTPFGHTQGVVAVFVGYGINIMLAIFRSNRLLLVNGTHRAYALHSLGITRAPCAVLHVSCKDDLELVGLPISTDEIESYFRAPRPTLLRDYFDPLLCAEFPASPCEHVIQLELKFTQTRTATR